MLGKSGLVSFLRQAKSELSSHDKPSNARKSPCSWSHRRETRCGAASPQAARCMSCGKRRRRFDRWAVGPLKQADRASPRVQASPAAATAATATATDTAAATTTAGTTGTQGGQASQTGQAPQTGQPPQTGQAPTSPQRRPSPQPGNRSPTPPGAATRPRPAVKKSAPPPKPPEPEEVLEPFVPKEPASFEEAQLSESALEELILRYLLARGEDTGQGIADQTKMPFTMVSNHLSRMKYDKLIHYRGMSSLNDYVVELTDGGRERARQHSLKCTYYGAAPVSLKDYCESVKCQSLQHQNPTRDDLERAFSDLLINKSMFTRLGAAMNSGRGMFLFGFPGNGKTSIAERVTKAFGETIWIPRAIGIEGEIIRVFDPSQHDAVPMERSGDCFRSQNRPAVDPHQTADDHCRWRTDHGQLGTSHRTRPLELAKLRFS